MSFNTVLDQIYSDVLQPLKEKKRGVRKKQSGVVQELFYENRGGRRASEKGRESDRQREEGWQMVTC